MNVRELAATSGRLRHVAGRLGLGERAYTRARELAELEPDAVEWRALVDRFLLVFGVALILAGVTAFFAYNWAGLHKFWKFGLIEGGIVAGVAVAARLGLDRRGGRISLLTSGFLVGVLLSVYTQVYQAGADPYQLFVTWGLMIAGWAWIGRQAGLWMLFLLLVNLSVIFFWTQVLYPQPFDLGVFGPLAALAGTFTDARLADLVFALNSGALLVWEWRGHRPREPGSGRTFPRVVALLAVAPVVFSSIVLIFASLFESEGIWNVIALVLFTAFAAACLSYYRSRVHDLFILTVCLLGGIVIVTSLFARMGFGGFSTFFVLAALVVGQTAGAAFWLRRVAQGWEAEG